MASIATNITTFLMSVTPFLPEGKTLSPPDCNDWGKDSLRAADGTSLK